MLGRKCRNACPLRTAKSVGKRKFSAEIYGKIEVFEKNPPPKKMKKDGGPVYKQISGKNLWGRR